jgi:phage terminase large subunit-like protein
MGRLARVTNWDTSCKDWQEKIALGKSLCPQLPLNKELADRAERVFRKLKLPDVIGNPPMDEAAGDWFIEIVRAAFGSYDPATKERHIRELFLMVPKKNSKTTYAAAFLLTAVLVSPRPRAEYIFIGPTQEIADLAFKQAAGMIEIDPVLRAKFHIQSHIKKIVYRPTGAFLKVKSFSPTVVTGSKPAGVLIDEIHVIGQMNNADRIIGQLRGGLISQPEAFLINITTQSERAPAGVFKSELMKARKVRDGTLQAPILPILYEFPVGMEWRDKKNWSLVTPNNGKSINVERLISDYEQAEAAGEEEIRRWASQHLNVEIGLALMSDRWAGADFWEQCGAEKKYKLESLIEQCEVIDIGIDGGGLDDLLGFAVVGRVKESGKWMVWTHAWAHPSVLQRRKSESARFHDFANDGDLSIVDSIGQDVDAVAFLCAMVAESGLLDKIGVDPHGLGGILDALMDKGITNDKIIGISQGWKLTGAIKTTERKLAEGHIIHSGQPLMAWCVSNARVEPRGNAISITKQAAGYAKIDPLMALFNAISLISLNPEAAGGRLDDYLNNPLSLTYT